MNKKNVWDEKLLHELFVTTRQTTKKINIFANNMSTDIKLSKAQLSEIIQSDGFICNMLNNLGEKVIVHLAVPLARDNLPGLVSDLASNATNKFERKKIWKGAVRIAKGFILFISSEDLNDIFKFIKSSEDSNVLINAIT